MAESVDIKDYINLYNTGYSLDSVKPLNNQTYKIFRMSKVDIRIVCRKEVYNNPLAYKKIRYFVKDNEYFYMIPIKTLKGTIVGFILRSLFGSSYSTISREFNNQSEQVPLMFGFDKHFAKYDNFNKSYPIIVCEGCKDCLTLKKIYPFVVTNNTSSMGVNSVVLRNITNKFLLAYDNDKAGKEGMEKDSKYLRQTCGAFVDTINIPEGYKDCTDCAINKDGSLNKKQFLKLKEQVVRKLKILNTYS